jgi:hypothetical protein
MRWYGIPEVVNLQCNEIGEFRNPKTGQIRQPTYKAATAELKNKGRARLNNVQYSWTVGKGATVARARLVLMAKLGRPLEPWEDACHIDGDPTNDSMSNLEAKSRLRNIIDEYKLGRLPELPDSEIDKAIAELQALKKIT